MLILGLLTMTLMSWGVGGLFDKKAVEGSTATAVFVVFHLFCLPVAIVLALCVPFIYPDFHIANGVIFWEGLNAIGALIALLAYYYAMEKAQASYVLGITAGYPILSQLIAIPMLGEELSLVRLGSAVLVSLGVAAIGYSAKEGNKSLSRRTRTAVTACIVITTVLWAALGIFEKQSLTYGRPLEAYLAISIWKSLLVVLVSGFLFLRKSQVKLKSRKLWTFSWLSALLVTAGNLGFVFALAACDASFVIVATAGYPLIMYAGAVALLDEKINGIRLFGIVLIVASAVLVSVA